MARWMSEGAASTGAISTPVRPRRFSNSSRSKGLAAATTSAPFAPLERQHGVPAREGAREGAGDEPGVELERVDLAVGDPHRPGHRLRGLVLVDQLRLAARVGELEGGEQLDRRDLGPAQAPTAVAGAVAEQPGPLDPLPREGGAAGVLAEQPLAGEELRHEVEGVVGGAVGLGHASGVYPSPAGPAKSPDPAGVGDLPRPGEVPGRARPRPPLARVGPMPGGDAADWRGRTLARPTGRGAQIPQPTGPHGPGGAPPPGPTRAAAGRDIRRDTSRARQAGHATSDSSDFLRRRASKTSPHDAQAYS